MNTLILFFALGGQVSCEEAAFGVAKVAYAHYYNESWGDLQAISSQYYGHACRAASALLPMERAMEARKAYHLAIRLRGMVEGQHYVRLSAIHLRQIQEEYEASAVLVLARAAELSKAREDLAEALEGYRKSRAMTAELSLRYSALRIAYARGLQGDLRQRALVQLERVGKELDALMQIEHARQGVYFEALTRSKYVEKYLDLARAKILAQQYRNLAARYAKLN